MNENLIVTRHAPLVAWLEKHGITGKVIAQATPEDVRGKNVYGVLPMWLGAEANTVTEVSMPGIPLEARTRMNGGDFTIEEMDSWGASMRTFVVTADPKIIADVHEFGKLRFEQATESYFVALRSVLAKERTG